MSMIDLRENYRRYEQAWARQDWEALRATLSPRYTFHYEGIARDQDEMLTWSKNVFIAFPDYVQHIKNTYRDGDTVIAKAVGGGTHTGPLALGNGRSLPPTGRSFESTYVKILQFDDNGLLVDDRQYQDLGGLLAQLSAG
jgi:predicted ester cyclase